MKKIYLSLIILAVVLVGSGAYYFGTQKTSPVKVVNNEPVISPTLVPTVTLVPSIVPTATPTIDETANLKTAIKKALVAKHGATANELVITVSKILGEYARGGASVPNEGGGMWFAAKVNNTWQLVWDGNGVILCSDLTAYPNFPTSMIPECYNDKTEKMLVR